ncbi:MAG: hypothetical protein HY015_04495 [Bacteroidetes bacterium]|nr:hypothetical protein [Bacteroidota bacterium]
MNVLHWIGFLGVTNSVDCISIESSQKDFSRKPFLYFDESVGQVFCGLASILINYVPFIILVGMDTCHSDQPCSNNHR